MICAYCKKESKPTKEHIISSGILDLFPECFLTIDSNRGKIYPADPMVNDVCAVCNNQRISYIDSYAKNFISQYFLSKYGVDDTLNINFDYALIQKMLLKYAFNDMRSKRENTDFFDDDILHFLMNESETAPLKTVTVLAGLAVNNSPAPDFMFGNQKLQWCQSPIFFSNSIVDHINYETGQIHIREPREVETFEFLAISYLFRFNSVQFIILCWDKGITDEILERNNTILKLQYPYAMLSDSNTATLSRCTSETTYHLFNLIDVTWGQSMFDEITAMRNGAEPGTKAAFEEITKEWEIEERKLAEEHKRN